MNLRILIVSCTLLLLCAGGGRDGIVAQGPENPSLREASRRADEALRREAFQEARPLLEAQIRTMRARRSFPERLAVARNLAECYCRLSLQDELRTLCNEFEREGGSRHADTLDADLRYMRALQFIDLSEYEKALPLLDRCITSYRTCGNDAKCALAIDKKYVVVNQLEGAAAALPLAHQLLSLFERLGDQRQCNRQRGRLGALYSDLGLFGKASDFLFPAVEASRANGWREQLLQHLLYTGILYEAMHDRQAAKVCYEEVVRESRTQGLQALLAAGLHGIANCTIGEKPAEAVAFISESIAINKRIRNTEGVFNAFTALGQIFWIREDYDKAEAAYREAESVVGTGFAKRAESELLLNRAELAERRGRIDVAESMIRKYLAKQNSPPWQRIDPSAYDLAGFIMYRAGRLKEARELYRVALAEVERSARTLDVQSPLRKTFLTGNTEMYVTAASVFEALGEPDSAFELLERGKGRISRDRFAREYITDPSSGIDESSLITLFSLTRRIESLRDRTAARAAPDPSLAALEEQRDCVQKRWIANDPVLQRMVGWRIPSMREVQRRIRERHAAIVEFGCNLEQILAICMTGDETRAVVIPILKKDLKEMVQELIEALEAPAESVVDPYYSVVKARALYDRLLGPFADMLRGRNNLVVIPDGPLSMLPFEMLVTDTTGCVNEYDVRHARFMVEDHDISYDFSSALYLQDEALRTRARGGMLLIGPPHMDAFRERSAGLFLAPSLPAVPNDQTANVRDRNGVFPPLAWALREVEDIASRFSPYVSALLVERDATKKRFRETAADAQIIHIATHQLVDDNHPLESRFLLAPDSAGTRTAGNLTLGEILRMKLQTDLVVLSACRTGKAGYFMPGEGFESVARGFYLAGASSVVMTLWRVADRQSSDLMVGFYKYLAEGRPRAEALASAKRDMLRGGNRHPFFWAGYILQGNPGKIEMRKVGRGTQWYLAVALLLLVAAAVYISFRLKRPHRRLEDLRE